MLKYLNGLLCLHFKCRKWVLDYGKIEWYYGIKVFYHCQISPFFSFCMLDAHQQFKVLTILFEISSLWFRCMSRIIFNSNKVFYFSQIDAYVACFLSKIHLHLEREAWFYLAQSFRHFTSNRFFIQRKRSAPWK